MFIRLEKALRSRVTRKGLDALIARIGPLKAQAIAVEATGGFETVVAAKHNPLLKPHRRRKAKNGCSYRCRQKAPHNPQRHHQRQSPMAKRLTINTVAHPARQ
jgi:hypothetical protein